MLCRFGVVAGTSDELKNHLTVQPEKAHPDFPAPPKFRVYRKYGDRTIIVPRFSGTAIQSDVRKDPALATIEFRGKLRTATKQNEAYDSAIQALQTIGGGLLSLYCGAGKTATALAVASHFRVRTMILVHKEFLADQWIENIKRFSPLSTIGRIQGDTFDIEKDFVVCMIQTLSQREFQWNLFDSVGMLIVDECHHICARVFSQCMFKLCPKYILGLSATPDRKDGLTRVLHWFIGPTCFELKREAEGVTVIPVHYASILDGSSLAESITLLTQDDTRNELILNLVNTIDKARNILILTDRRDHVQFLADQLDAGIYMGGMKQEQLDESALKRIIVGTFSLAQEGLDIPKLDTVIFATPKSDIVQAAGRILRGGSFNAPVVYDIVDSSLYGMFKKRCSQYNSMKFSFGGQEEKGDDEHEYKMYRFDDE
jgi:superfamily II DNA or RNA helicase